MLWRGDGDGVHFLLLEDVTEVLFACRSIAQLSLGVAAKLFQNAAIHVRKICETRRHPCFALREER